MTEEEKLYQLTMPLDEKIQRSKELIYEWYLQFGGKVYVSYSGGKDSTVLLHLARSIKGCKDIIGVFCDTGLEYPEVRQHVKDTDNITWIKPKKTFKQVIEKYGWPIISKEQAKYIQEYRTTKSEKLKQIHWNGGGKNGTSGKISECWKPLILSDIPITYTCCDVMKKRPFKKFEKETGMKPIIGTMFGESTVRARLYMSGNCNAFSQTRPISRPLSFWNEQDILEYIRRFNIEIPKVYGDIVEKDGELALTGCSRTGCMFCMFGLHLDPHPNRFEQMAVTHPAQYKYIMETLKGRHVMEEYLKCNWRKNR